MNSLNNIDKYYIPNTLDGIDVINENIQTDALLVDGTNFMLADLNVGGHNVKNVATATTTDEAINLGQLNSTLGNYVDLTSTQTIGGSKTFSNQVTFNGATKTNLVATDIPNAGNRIWMLNDSLTSQTIAGSKNWSNSTSFNGPNLNTTGTNVNINSTNFTISATTVTNLNNGANCNNKKLTNVLDPTNAQDGATKNYVDASVNLLRAYVDTQNAADRAYADASVNLLRTYVDTQDIALKAYTDSSLNLLRSYVNAQDVALKAYTDSSLNLLRAYVDAQDTSGRAYVDASLNLLRAYVDAQDTSGRAYVDASLNLLRAYVDAQDVALKAYTDTSLNLLRAYVDTQDTLARAYVDASLNLKVNRAGDTMTGNLNVILPGTSTTTNKVLNLETSGNGLWLNPYFSAGSYNPLVASGDKGIIFSNGSADTGNLVIAPWSSSSKGVQINSSGVTTTNKNATNYTYTTTTLSSVGTTIVATGSTIYDFYNINASNTFKLPPQGSADSFMVGKTISFNINQTYITAVYLQNNGGTSIVVNGTTYTTYFYTISSFKLVGTSTIGVYTTSAYVDPPDANSTDQLCIQSNIGNNYTEFTGIKFSNSNTNAGLIRVETDVAHANSNMRFYTRSSNSIVLPLEIGPTISASVPVYSSAQFYMNNPTSTQRDRLLIADNSGGFLYYNEEGSLGRYIPGTIKWSIDREGNASLKNITRSSWSSGELIQTKIYNQNTSGNGVLQINAGSGVTTWKSLTFTMKNTVSDSYLVVEAFAPYHLSGDGQDKVLAQIRDFTSSTEQEVLLTGQYWDGNGGGGTRSGIILPMMASYTPTVSTTNKTRTIEVRFNNYTNDTLYVCRIVNAGGIVADCNYYTIKISEYKI